MRGIIVFFPLRVDLRSAGTVRSSAARQIMGPGENPCKRKNGPTAPCLHVMIFKRASNAQCIHYATCRGKSPIPFYAYQQLHVAYKASYRRKGGTMEWNYQILGNLK